MALTEKALVNGSVIWRGVEGDRDVGVRVVTEASADASRCNSYRKASRQVRLEQRVVMLRRQSIDKMVINKF